MRMVALLAPMLLGCSPHQRALVRPGFFGFVNPRALAPASYVDGPNTSGCASDANDCTAASCSAGGVGPCLTWRHQHAELWGCNAGQSGCPTQTANLAIHFLGAQQAGDYFAFWPEIAASNITTTIDGPLNAQSQVGTGTISGITQLTNQSQRGTNGFPVVATLTPTTGSIAPGQMIRDTTAGCSMWVDSNVSGNQWNLSQCIANYVSGANPSALVAIASSDAYTAYVPVLNNCIAIGSTNGNANQEISIKNLQLGNSSGTLCTVGPNVTIAESLVGGYLYALYPGSNLQPLYQNNYSGFVYQSSPGPYPISGFYVNGGLATGGQYFIGDMTLDGDFVTHETIDLMSGVAKNVYMGSSTTLNTWGVVTYSGTVYGPGQTFWHFGSAIAYPGGANAAANTLPLTGGARATGPKWAVDSSADPAVWHPRSDDQHTFVLDLDKTIGTGGYGMGATTNCGFAAGNVSFCNTGP